MKVRFVFACFLALLECMRGHDAAVLHVPMERMQATASPRARVWEPQFPVAIQPHHDNGGLVADIELYQLTNMLCYAGYIAIGTPRQTVRVVFDTMSSDLWVLNHPNHGHGYYNHSASTTFKGGNHEIPYEDVKALISTDRIALGDDAAIVVPELAFLEVAQAPDMGGIFADVNFDGVMGLSLAPLSTATNSSSLIHTLVQHGLLEVPIIGIKLTKGVNGHLTLGGVNNTYFTGPINYVDVVAGHNGKKEDWLIDLDEIRVGDLVVAATSTTIFYPTLLPLVLGPPHVVDKIATSLGAKLVRDKYLIACNPSHAPDITIVLGGNVFVLTTEDYIGVYHDQGRCMLKFQPFNGTASADWVIGDVLLRKHYGVLDYGMIDSLGPRVGFAKLA